MNILAVDADPASLAALQTKLQGAFPDAEVTSFRNSLDAIKYGMSHTVNILFTDVRLRPVDGYFLIETLRARQTFLAYVVSGTREKPDSLDWMNVNGYFAKPITEDELLSVAKALDEKRTSVQQTLA